VLPKESEEEYMRNIAKIEKEEFDKGFMCPAEQLWFEQTMKQGIEQSNKKIIQIVRNMLASKLSINKIANITGVSIEEIKKLKNK
jgi:predicted transposase/invertase (TIGR01784 family)